MKKLIAVLTLFVGLSANASLLSVSVSDTKVSVGESFDVIVTANMADAFNFLEFQLDFDRDLFEYPTGFSSAFTSLVSSYGILETNFTEFGFAFSFAEDLFEPELASGEYEAARFTLTAKTESPNFATFSFADGLTFAFDSLGILDISPDPLTGNASVAVSAPATLGLFAVALFGLVGLRRKA